VKDTTKSAQLNQLFIGLLVVFILILRGFEGFGRDTNSWSFSGVLGACRTISLGICYYDREIGEEDGSRGEENREPT